jgi:hypothetical protein
MIGSDARRKVLKMQGKQGLAHQMPHLWRGVALACPVPRLDPTPLCGMAPLDRPATPRGGTARPFPLPLTVTPCRVLTEGGV